MKRLKLALIGFGNVGQGFIKVLKRYKAWILGEYEMDVQISYIVDPIKGSIYVEDGVDIDEILEYVEADGNIRRHPKSQEIDSKTPLRDGDVDVVIEVTPTNLSDGEPGYTHIKLALENGKHVITTNKGPLALYYRELVDMAEEYGLYLGYEGTVMSGTPLIKLLRYGMLRDITNIRGILNGTTNYILTLMENGKTFEEALAEAQSLGIAEADPTMDIDGYDLQAKAAILINTLLDEGVSIEDIERNSLAQYIKKRGYKRSLKYVADLDFIEGRYLIHPIEVLPGDPLLSAKGVTNMVVINSETLGKISISGPGAGREETGYAILSDLIDMIRRYRT